MPLLIRRARGADGKSLSSDIMLTGNTKSRPTKRNSGLGGRYLRGMLRTAVESSHGIFSVTKGLGGSQATVGRPMDTVNKRVASLAQRHFASQNSGDID